MTSYLDQSKFKQLLEEEREYHNVAYRNATPFDFGSFKFDREQVWEYFADPWRDGQSITGRRNRRFLERMDLTKIAGKRILDVGCGNGQFSVFFAMYGAEVWGIELSEVGIDVANATAQMNGVSDSCHFIVGDATATDFPTGHFDYITFSAALHHLVKYPGMREETWRLLKPSGAIVFCDILRDNKIYNACKSIYHVFNPETDSGVNIKMEDYEEFWHGYETVIIEQFSLLEGWKRFVPKKVALSAPGRSLLRVTTKADEALLSAFPKLRRYCLEIVGSVRKPADASPEPPSLAVN